jgi:hypothetical protein
MLGRLKMTVPDCLKVFGDWSRKIFDGPRLLFTLNFLPKYSDKSLREAITDVIKLNEPCKDDESEWKKDAFVALGDRCKT